MEAKKKIHWVDVAIVALIALCLVAAVLFLQGRSSAGEEQQTRPMAYTVLLKDMPAGQVGLPREEGAVFNSNNGNYLGTLLEVGYEHAWESKYNPDLGKYVVVENPDRYDVYITVTNDGYETEKDIVVGGYVIKVGEELNIRGKGYAGRGIVADIMPDYAG